MTERKDKNEEQMVKEISEGIVKLGYGFIPSEKEKEKINKRKNKRSKIENISSGFFSAVRSVVYP